jgi:hypothetical protein
MMVIQETPALFSIITPTEEAISPHAEMNPVLTEAETVSEFSG